MPRRTDPSGHGARSRIAGVLVVGLLLAGCTGDASWSGPGRELPPPEPTVTLEPRPAPPVVRVTRVAGRLPARDRRALERNAGRVVTRWFDEAYLGGTQPRTDFSGAFAAFTPGARRQARGDRGLLTNALLGARATEVVPHRRAAYLSVLAPYGVAAGVTARIELAYLVLREDRPDRQVTVRGRLVLTRAERGGWEIFGYDLSRSVRPGGAGGAA